MKSVLILGGKGMLGYAMTEYYSRKGYKVVSLGRSEFNIAKDPMSHLEAHLGGVDFVINCAGVIKPMIANTSIEDVLRVNAIFPRNLAKLCNQRGIPCFHVTTDCVYSGKKGAYTESDYFDADDVYGMSKNAGEIADCMVLRTSIIGEEKGQARSLLEWARSQKGKQVNGFTNHHWNGVTTLYLAEIVETIVNRGKYAKGIFHVHSPDTVTKLGLLQIFNEAYDLSLTINPAEAKEACDRSLKSNFPLSSEVSVKMLKTQVQEMRRFFS